MRVWIDLSNSPHVQLFGPVVDRLRELEHDVLLTARDHAQTAELAVRRWPDVVFVGSQSPGNRLRKASSALERARALARLAARWRPEVALSHGSYAQLLAARLRRIPAVTMMDYEYQPANHLSFRLARRVIVPDAFPAQQLRHFGARGSKVVRYEGFKEELYLTGYEPSPAILESLSLDREKVVVLLRPPPEGALYHRAQNTRFHEVVSYCSEREDVDAVLLPRTEAQREQFAGESLTMPRTAPDALSLAAYADVVVGAGGTMNREAALLGAATYTLFAGRLAAVDAKLVELGYMHDLRADGALPVLERRDHRESRIDEARGRELLRLVVQTVEDAG